MSPAFFLYSLLFLSLLALGETANTDRQCACILNNLWLDVVLVIDQSEIMTNAGLEEVASNINSVFGYGQVRIGTNHTDLRSVRVGVVTYDLNATIVGDLDQFQSSEDLDNMAYNLKTTFSDESNLEAGLIAAETVLGDSRPNFQKVIIAYASDFKNFNNGNLEATAERIKDSGVTLITVSFVNRNDHNQIGQLRNLATYGDGFSMTSDDYVSEEVQKALCRANCFCPTGFVQYSSKFNDSTATKYGTCLSASSQLSTWQAAKFSCQNSQKGAHLVTEFNQQKQNFNSELAKSDYFIGLHFVNGGYFWEQAAGEPLLPLDNNFYPLESSPTANQCVSDASLKWANVNCFKDQMPYICEVTACDTDNYCA